ncbi:probable calcium-binding protein CML46 [Cicer arietinum]|uniref:Probable calcium-binding protein CML45 n=1 Tax=Cicer arietinum TaxID=3827 RepID=A0A1S2YPF1_CICAR|nr:probable calcium-binding protein CML45 [Cicer arietinum]
MVLSEMDYFFPDDTSHSNINSTSPLFGSIQLFLYFTTFFNKINKFFSSFKFFLLCQLHSSSSEVRVEKKILESNKFNHQENNELNVGRESGEIIERDEVKMVMEKMGLFCSSESEELDEKYGSNDLSELFEEKEPSLEEVKMAFDVFDENKDGFIDPKELQRLLVILGFKEALEFENCQKMINNFDQNQDGRIDFMEFVIIMGNLIC